MTTSLDIQSLIDDIIEGLTYRQMAAKYNCSLGTIHNFLSSDEHSARANEARQISADGYADMAEQVLVDAPADKFELQRARDLAHHYRWKASKRSPKVYGEASLLKLADNEGNKLEVSKYTDEELEVKLKQIAKGK